MVNDHTRNMIWNDYIDVARVNRFYQKLANRYSKCQKTLRFILLIPFVHGIMILLDFLPKFIGLTMGLIIASAVIIDLVLELSKKANKLGFIVSECADLEDEYKVLWDKINNTNLDLSDNFVYEKIIDFSKRRNNINNYVSDIRGSEKMNKKCAEDAYKELEEKYSYVE